jgi:glucan phosphorylase
MLIQLVDAILAVHIAAIVRQHLVVVASYKPREYYEQDEELHQALTQIGTGVFSPSEPGRYAL